MRETPSATREAPGARFLFRLAKKARKRWTGLTTITQDPGDLLDSPLGQAVVNNACQHFLLRQSPQAIERVGQAFGLTTGRASLPAHLPDRPRPADHRRAAHPARGEGEPATSTSSSPATPPSSPEAAREARRCSARAGARAALPVLLIGAAAGRARRRQQASVSASPRPSVEQVAGIPPEYLRLFQAAGARLRRAVEGARRDREGRVRRRARPRPVLHAGGRGQLRGRGRPDAVPRLHLGRSTASASTAGRPTAGTPPTRSSPPPATCAPTAPRRNYSARSSPTTTHRNTSKRSCAGPRIYEQRGQHPSPRRRAARPGAALAFALAQLGVPYV